MYVTVVDSPPKVGSDHTFFQGRSAINQWQYPLGIDMTNRLKLLFGILDEELKTQKCGDELSLLTYILEKVNILHPVQLILK